MEQHQMLASWRSLLGGAMALIKMGRANELAAARQNIDQVRTEMFLAQILGMPEAEWPEEDE